MRTKMIKRIKVNPQAILRCIGCGSEVKSGFCYTGKMITGLQFATIKTGEQTLYSLDKSDMKILEEKIESERKVAYYHRKHGPVCDSCSALCARTITDRNGEKHQVLILDPRQGFLGSTIEDEMSKRSYKPLNTTFTK